jgi:hypothetical protein
MRSLTWMGLGLSGVLLLGMAARSAGAERGARAEPVLEIMSLDQGDCTLGLSCPWGAMAVNHVLFNDHSGPFKAVVESSGKGVRVTFDGWGKEPFVASADKVRIIYWVAGRKEIDFVAEAISGGAVRVRPVDRPVTQGRRIVIGLGERAAKGVANVSVEGRTN